ncbi:MAG: outer membrane protein [Flavobacteriaceae bacterium]
MTLGRKSMIAAGAMFLAVPAMAADMPQPQANNPVYQQAPTQAAYLWSGPYIGLNAGYGWGNADSVVGGAPITVDPDGFIGGIQGGINFQSGNFVYGVEGDFNFSDADAGALGYGVEQNWLATIRARLGVAFDRSLIYATGGAAFTDVNVRLAGSGATSTSLTGWTLGAGWEYAVNDRFTVRAEYLYNDFSDENLLLGVTPANVDLNQSIARVGVNWKFGGF